MKIGYARCSTNEQNLDWQLDALHAENCERIYQEKMSGAKFDRPELQRMLDALREGDEVIVCELTRLSRSTSDLVSLMQEFEKRGVAFRSLKESWIDTTTPGGKLIFTIFAGLAEFERNLIRQRTRAGLEAARARGRCGGRPKTSPVIIKEAVALYNSKMYTLKEIEEKTGISRVTLYAYLRSQNSEQNKSQSSKKKA